MTVSVQQQAFDIQAQYELLLGSRVGAGVATFTGYVRDLSEGGPVTALELEHYPGMTEKVLGEIGASAEQRFGLLGWRIVHRFGLLGDQEAIVWVGTVADHRTEAFAGCQFIMDSLKTRAPFWKREHLEGGNALWVKSKAEDLDRELAWQEKQV